MSIELPPNLELIGSEAFSNCINLKNVTFLNPNTVISEFAFKTCYLLTRIDLPSNLTIIPVGAFESCSNLYNVNLPESVKEIGESAFCDCGLLIFINLSNIEVIGKNLFTILV